MINPDGTYTPELSIFPHAGVFAGLDVWNAIKGAENAQRQTQLDDLNQRLIEARVGEAEMGLEDKKAYEEAVRSLPPDADPSRVMRIAAEHSQNVTPWSSYAKTITTEAGKGERQDKDLAAKMARLQKVEEMKLKVVGMQGANRINALRLIKEGSFVDPITGQPDFLPEYQKRLEAKLNADEAMTAYRKAETERINAMTDPLVKQTIMKTGLLGQMSQYTSLKANALQSMQAHGGFTPKDLASLKLRRDALKLAIQTAIQRVESPSYKGDKALELNHLNKLKRDIESDETAANLFQIPGEGGDTSLEQVLMSGVLDQGPTTPSGVNTSAWHPEADGGFGGNTNPTPTHSDTAPGTIPPQKTKADFVFDPTSGSMVPSVPAGASR